MVPVIGAIAAASKASRSEENGIAVPGKRDRAIGTCSFNIGRIPVRQSRRAGRFERLQTANLAEGQKKRSGKLCDSQLPVSITY
jgi:hypothetical protein